MLQHYLIVSLPRPEPRFWSAFNSRGNTGGQMQTSLDLRRDQLMGQGIRMFAIRTPYPRVMSARQMPAIHTDALILPA